MKFLKNKITWGGLLRFFCLLITIAVVLICRAFKVHKIIADGFRKIKNKLLD